MADETPDVSAAGAMGADAPSAGAGKGGDVQDTFDRAYVEDLRAENAKRRLQIRDLEQQVKDLAARIAPDAKPARADDALKVVTEKLDSFTGMLKELDERANRQALYHALREESIRAGVIDLDAALKLVDPAAVTVDPDGTVKGAAEAIAALSTAKPYLFNRNQPPPNTGATLPAQGTDDSITAIQKRVREKLANPYDDLSGFGRGGGLVLPWEG